MTKREGSNSPVKSSPLKKSKIEEESCQVSSELKENMAPVVVVDNKVEISEEAEVKVAKSPVKNVVVPEIKEITPRLYFAKLSDKAHVPSKGSKLAAGYDLKSAYKYTVPARGSCMVKTDIQIKLPSGYYGRVAPRSGLALKNKLDVGAGVIDEDYRGNVGVILFNFGDADFEINEGDRVAQLICEKICYPEIVELESLDETERGEGGFGSTGVAEQKSS
ncbi:Deoxyuridine 5'-triphosphate nucleotidohydrolase, mitochondrial [Folsomia candida]|uniref:Deoxyuridine 5'-triphosphate nucleotidohydrolase n=2 Tax=Folsomia candida TaxID=158441 RepID=A0A226EG19_FOLCA|nr:Deoxyuridine 5'-triphosphate nucleotidohydrolase, mitochondrial [Folsomia candida]